MRKSDHLASLKFGWFFISWCIYIWFLSLKRFLPPQKKNKNKKYTYKILILDQHQTYNQLHKSEHKKSPYTLLLTIKEQRNCRKKIEEIIQMKKEKLKWKRNNSNREFSRPSIFSLRPEYTERIRFLIFNLVWTNNIKVVFSFLSFFVVCVCWCVYISMCVSMWERLCVCFVILNKLYSPFYIDSTTLRIL